MAHQSTTPRDEGELTDAGIIIYDLNNATGKALTTFVNCQLQALKKANYEGFDMWDAFRADFCDWDFQLFNKIAKTTIREL